MSTRMSAPPARRLSKVLGSLGATAIAVLVVACNSPASTATATASATPGTASPSGGPSPSSAVQSPSPEPTVGAIDHKTGATDVVLRSETGGGLVPIDFLATQAPTFTLYGNGVIVFQPKVDTFPQPDANGVARGIPWRTAKLDESQVQDLLEFALGPGGLGGARETYMEGGVADVPSTIFTVKAGGIDKVVTVNALNDQPEPGPDALVRTLFFKLATRLQDFDEGGKIPSDVYEPERYRAVLLERELQPGVQPLDWPWSTIPFADFKEGVDGSGPTTFPHRVVTVDDAAALKLDGIEGGVQGVAIKAPNGKIYGLVIRPLLADEAE